MIAITHTGNRAFFPAQSTVASHARLRWLKRAIWVYLLLLLFEGALRKWVLTGLATPLLVVRDPVALLILLEALRQRIFPLNPAACLSLFIGWIGILLAVTVGHGSAPVALYGARPLLLHFPAMFVMARVLDRADIVRIGKFMLALALLMTPLIIWQFYSPQTAWANRGVGGEGSAGFAGALGYYRPPGTFSFTNGVAQFYSLLAVFVFWFWLDPGRVNRPLLLAGTIALLVALPFSVSRTLVFQCVLTLAFAVLAAITRPRLLHRGLLAAAVMTIVVVILSPFGFFQTAMEVIETRFTLASMSEGGLQGTLVNRYIGGLTAAFSRASEFPFWGHGLGMGTNAGAVLLSGKAQFLIAEGEWQRWVGELGVIFGFLLIGMRLWVTAAAASKSARALLRGDILPWLLLANAITQLPQGNWNQPTSLGFAIMAGVLLLASLRRQRG